MSFAEIEGQDSAVRVLRHALQTERIGQAYLFVGPSGVGKQKTAIALARAALCLSSPGEGCDRCETCRRVNEGKHPDARIFEPRDEGNRNLQVEQLRSEILPLAKFAPFEGAAAFLIFPQADVSFPVQHPEAANALLKTLEEPRPNVHFVLLSERPERLLPTIRSRCQRVRFSRLPNAALARILDRHGAPAASREPALALAAGRADRALALCENDRAQQVAQWTLRIDEALARPNSGVLLDLASELASSEDRAIVLESLQTFYRDVAARALGVPAAELAWGSRADVLEARSLELAAGAAASRVARLQQIGEDIERNANPEIALDGALFALAARA
jgi:DNA polymerase III subunit delta'